MVDATGIFFNKEEFELLVSLNRDPSLYLKFKGPGRKDGLELKFTPDEIKAIREWLGRLTQ